MTKNNNNEAFSGVTISDVSEDDAIYNEILSDKDKKIEKNIFGKGFDKIKTFIKEYPISVIIIIVGILGYIGLHYISINYFIK